MDALIHWLRPGIAAKRRSRESHKRLRMLLLLLSVHTSMTAAADPPHNVLVIYSDDRLLPANLELDAALRESLARRAGRPVEIYAEFLEGLRFSGAAYEATMSAFLAKKYSEIVPEVVVLGGAPATRF